METEDHNHNRNCLLDCIRLDKHNCCNIKCAHFIVVVILSIVAIIVSLLGFCDLFIDEIPTDFYTGLITLVIGVWLRSPKIKN